METGFSSWAKEETPEYWPYAWDHTEDDQQRFINIALPIIYDKVYHQNSVSDNKILLSTWYCLRGSEPYGIWDIESNFGIVHDNYWKKIAYDNLQYQIKQFY